MYLKDYWAVHIYLGVGVSDGSLDYGLTDHMIYVHVLLCGTARLYHYNSILQLHITMMYSCCCLWYIMPSGSKSASDNSHHSIHKWARVVRDCTHWALYANLQTILTISSYCSCLAIIPYEFSRGGHTICCNHWYS